MLESPGKDLYASVQVLLPIKGQQSSTELFHLKAFFFFFFKWFKHMLNASY